MGSISEDVDVRFLSSGDLHSRGPGSEAIPGGAGRAGKEKRFVLGRKNMGFIKWSRCEVQVEKKLLTNWTRV